MVARLAVYVPNGPISLAHATCRPSGLYCCYWSVFAWKTYAWVLEVCAWLGSSRLTLLVMKTTIREGGEPWYIHGSHTRLLVEHSWTASSGVYMIQSTDDIYGASWNGWRQILYCRLCITWALIKLNRTKVSKGLKYIRCKVHSS